MLEDETNRIVTRHFLTKIATVPSIHNFSSSVCEYFRTILCVRSTWIFACRRNSPHQPVSSGPPSQFSSGIESHVTAWFPVIPYPDEPFRLTRWSVTREATRVDFEPRRHCSRTFQADRPRVVVNDRAEAVCRKVQFRRCSSFLLSFFFFFQSSNRFKCDLSEDTTAQIGTRGLLLVVRSVFQSVNETFFQRASRCLSHNYVYVMNWWNKFVREFSLSWICRSL